MRYRYRLEKRKAKRLGFVRLIRKLAIASLVLIMFYLLFLYTGGRPYLTEDSLRALSLIPTEKTYTLGFDRPIKTIKIRAEQDGQKRELYYASFDQPTDKVSFTLKAKDLGLKDGQVRLTLEFSSGFLLNRSYSLLSTVDTQPPSLRVVAYTQSPSVGGSLALKVKVDEEAQVWFLHGEHRYRLYSVGERYHFGIFPIRLDVSQGAFRVEAVDSAGNIFRQELHINLREVKFKEDRINIDDSFVDRVVYPLLGKEGEGLSTVDAFRRINEVWRSRDVSKIKEVGLKSEPRVMWEGAFIQLPNSKVFAGYGDVRHYFYGAQKISESRHMGFDFASVERAPIPASNSGVVVFAGNLGIYGNVVIIDHGMGLMSLYGHLSEVSVKEGQFVKKGEIIGRTGATGLALGDHLHFGIVVQGYEVNPIEWLDAKWIKNNITSVFDAK
ncbi:MAG: M23 family metallopeptidase [Aquificaceae bacterium]|nr:M23 family metallopeptidase [Aquificaceae bacterium]